MSISIRFLALIKPLRRFFTSLKFCLETENEDVQLLLILHSVVVEQANLPYQPGKRFSKLDAMSPCANRHHNTTFSYHFLSLKNMEGA